MANFQLIVNADDFGFTRDVNEGIVEAHRNGILTATTLMANGAAFGHALELARANPTLDVGCHLTLVQGESVREPGRRLPESLAELVGALAGHRLDAYGELAAQIRKIRAAGIEPSHADTHKHTHLLPAVRNAVVRVAREFGIPWVRKPVDFPGAPGTGGRRKAVARAMRWASPGFGRALAGLKATDHFAGFQITGSLDTEMLVATLEKLPEGLTELMCHPGRMGPELAEAKTRLRQSRQTELAALTSAEVKEAVRRLGIVLTSYRGQ